MKLYNTKDQKFFSPTSVEDIAIFQIYKKIQRGTLLWQKKFLSLNLMKFKIWNPYFICRILRLQGFHIKFIKIWDNFFSFWIFQEIWKIALSSTNVGEKKIRPISDPQHYRGSKNANLISVEFCKGKPVAPATVHCSVRMAWRLEFFNRITGPFCYVTRTDMARAFEADLNSGSVGPGICPK